RQGGGGFRGPGGPSQMRQGGGGLLSKLLGRGNQQARGIGAGPLQTASRAAGAGGNGAGGILKTLSNPGAISGFLENTQKVLNSAQQFGPMVQQYGPMVKNIPAIWKLYRGLKGSSDEPAEGKNLESKEPIKAKKTSKAKQKVIDLEIDEITIEIEKESENEKKSERGISKPKLYV
ncbi:VrrA/YqfQ family protein, partial [Bacillus sp. JJ1532]|uniref:VrrA/YqfQ family protein n=1 Tax=Bacillus sp. JJ1532 TaxID=3122958 RepID=UPI002FFDCEF9